MRSFVGQYLMFNLVSSPCTAACPISRRHVIIEFTPTGKQFLSQHILVSANGNSIIILEVMFVRVHRKARRKNL